jgi:hypothetical protein
VDKVVGIVSESLFATVSLSLRKQAVSVVAPTLEAP